MTNAIQRKGISWADVPLIHIVTMNTMAAELPTVFTTQWCGYCVRLKTQLSRAGIDFLRSTSKIMPMAPQSSLKSTTAISPYRRLSSAMDLR